MAFAVNYRRGAAAVLAFLSASVLFGFGNSLDPWWPLLWFAPLPILLFAARSSWWAAAVTAGFSLLAGSFSMWHYFRVLHTPFAVWAAVYSIAALVFAAAVLLFRALLRRGASWSALLAFPAVWVSYEYARNFLTPHGTAGSFAYSQLNFLPFLQLASITGPWGYEFSAALVSRGACDWGASMPNSPEEGPAYYGH
jgi:apolipoprotein N-acyltransferase